MIKMSKLLGIIVLALVFSLIGCGGGGGSSEKPQTGGGGEDGLIGKWYATQEDANGGVADYKIPLEFTSDGKIKKYGEDESTYTATENTFTLNTTNTTHTFSISGTVLTTTGGNCDIIKDDPNKYYKPR